MRMVGTFSAVNIDPIYTLTFIDTCIYSIFCKHVRACILTYSVDTASEWVSRVEEIVTEAEYGQLQGHIGFGRAVLS